MIWLTEIENEATLALEGDEAFTEGYMDDLRMARVIRELAEYAPIVRLEEKSTAYANLSPDAKDVVNDSTAPRST